MVNRTRDGTLLQIDTEVQAVYGPQGELRYLVELSQDVTAQHRTLQALEAALRETDALLGTIQQHAIVSVTDRNGRITDVNEAFCRLSGYAHDELIGQDHRILNSGQQPAAFWAEMWQSLSAGRPWRGEICNRAKNGSLHWVDSIIAPVLGSDGQIERFIDIRHDITARKQMELRLRFSQDLLDRTGRIAGVGGWQYEPLNGKLDWSDQNYRIFDLVPGDAARPDDPLAYIPEPGRSALQEAARAAVHAGRAWDMEVPAITATGRAIWIRAVGEAEFENGVAVRMVGATQDITAARDAREKLDRATQLLRSVLDAATEIAVISTDARLDIVVFNAGAERLLGYRAEEVVGCASPSLFHDPMEVRLRALSMSEELGQPVAGMEVFTHPSVHGVPRDWTFVRKDGSRVQVSLVITPQTAEDGHIMGYVGVAHDITPRLQYEATLRQSMMQAEQVSLAKSQFLANMSHEIRTPMNAILGMLKLLQQTPLTERQREYAGKTEGAARALLALLNDILDFSKVEAGKMVLDRHPFALEAVLQNLGLMLSANVGIKPVELLFDVDPALLATRLLGDDLRLLQILINLGGNAVKFTMVGEVVVSLAQRARTAEQVSVRVAVRDTGIGIAPGALSQIFEGFSQAEASTTRRFGGSGLGLAICRRLVELMGGVLQVRSELGQGSEFWFDVDLPIVNEAPPADAPALPPARHVLVVDDNPCAREVLARQVHSLGWTCELASDADTALAALQQGVARGRPYQVVLLDWRMPGADGLALTQAIRAAHGREGLQIIVMVSAHDREELAQRSGLLPFRIDGYLVKPVTPGLLAEAVGSQPSRPRAVDAPTAVSNGVGRLAGLHLLLVEDNPNNRQIAEELLSAEGARIDIAVNGQEGVQAMVAADGHYDAVLMDVQMPVMDGLSAAQRVRELLGARTPPIIAMTAHASEADRAASAAAGMVDHISKPFELSHLVRVLRHHAGRPDPAMAVPAPTAVLPATVLAVAAELGIDIQAAWERLGRRLDVYGRLLTLFSKDLREAVPRLDAWWQMGDAEALRAWLHTTKGLSSTLGYTGMAATLAQAELGLQGSGIVPQLPTWWQATRTAVQEAIPVCLRLSEVLAAQTTSAAPVLAGDAVGPRLREALPILLDCLERSDMKALDLYESLQGEGMACEDPRWQDLCDSMSRLDFPAAAQQVRQTLADLSENQA